MRSHEQERMEKIVGESVPCGSKKIELPAYFTKIRSALDLEKVLLSSHEEVPRVQGVVFDLAAQTGLSKYMTASEGLIQASLPFLGESPYYTLRRNSAVLVDLGAEYLYYNIKHKKNIIIANLPDKIKRLAQNVTASNHSAFWNKLKRAKRLAQLSDWAVKYQAAMDVDLVLPFTPFITSENPSKMVDLTLRVNLLTKNIAEAYDREAAFYITLHDRLFSNYEFVADLADKLAFDEVILDNFDWFFIKIKNYTFNQDAVKRTNLKRFFDVLRISIYEEGKTIVLLDARTIGLIGCMAGLSGFVEPLDGRVRDYRGRSALSECKKRGGYYHPDHMIFYPYNDIRRIYMKNGKNLPCSCPACKSISGASDLNLLSDYGWNIKRRLHLLWTRNHEVQELRNLKNSGNLRGISDKIIRSRVKNYVEILPNGII